MSRRKQKKQVIQNVQVVPRYAQNTIYYDWLRTTGFRLTFASNFKSTDGKTEFYPLRLLNLLTVDGKPSIESKIRTADEEATITLYKKEFHREMYAGALAECDKNEVINKKWISKGKYENMSLPPTYTTKFDIGEKVWRNVIVHCNHMNACNCEENMIVVEVTVIALSPHKIAGQLTGQFDCRVVDRSLSRVADGLAFTAELSREKTEWRNIGISEILLAEIAHYIDIGYYKYLDSRLITEILPRWTIKDSAYFAKQELYDQQTQHLKYAMQAPDLMKSFAINILSDLIDKTYKTLSAESSILSFNITIRMTKNNVLKRGTYMQESIHDHGLKKVLNELQVKILTPIKWIIFSLTGDQLEELGITKIMKIHNNGRKTTINGPIKFVYHRKASRIVIPKLSVTTPSERRLQRKRRQRNHN